VERCREVWEFLTVICTPATAALALSVTLPLMVAVSGVWAFNENAQTKAVSNANNRNMILPPEMSNTTRLQKRGIYYHRS
jgi:hypothetical protein